MSKGAQLLLGATAVLGLVGWLAYSQVSEGAFRYYQDLGEFQADGEVGAPVRVHGYVATGSIERDVPGKQVHFRVQGQAPHAGGSADGAMTVTYASLETPDLFKDGAEVVVEGRLGPSGRFEATNVLAKCPSKFEAAAAEDAAGDRQG